MLKTFLHRFSIDSTTNCYCYLVINSRLFSRLRTRLRKQSPIFPRETNNFCLFETGTRIFPANYSNSFLIPGVTLSLRDLHLFPSLFRQRAEVLGSKSFSPCTYVTRHSAAKTVSRDAEPPSSPLLSSPLLLAQCLSSVLLRPSLFSRQKLLIYLSREHGRGKLTRDRREEDEGTRVEGRGGARCNN